MSDETLSTPMVVNPPSNGNITHQLQALPDLAPETPWYKQPVFWVLISFTLSAAVCLTIIGLLKIEGAGVLFITTSGGLHTTGALALGTDKIARKVPYMLAANKDGITQPEAK